MQTTMREANDRGFDCLLIEDATESYFPEFKAATLAMIRAQGGIVGWTAPLEVARGGRGGAGGMTEAFDAEEHVDAHGGRPWGSISRRNGGRASSQNMAATAAIAALLLAFPLSDHDEPAPVFEP